MSVKVQVVDWDIAAANPAAVLELLEKIEQLQSEVERLRAELATRCRVEGDTILDGLPKFEWWLMSRDDAEYYKVDDVRERLRAAPAAGTVEKDAARYRWLSDDCGDFEAMTSYWIYDELDEKIDAAIEAHKAGKNAAVHSAAGSIRPAPGEQVQRERRRFPESGSE